MICDGCNNEIGNFMNEEMVCPFCSKDLSHLSGDYVENKTSMQPSDSGNMCLESNKKVYAKKIAPISTFCFMLLQIVFFVPIVNLLFLFALSFKDGVNENIRAFARSFLVWYAIICTALLALIVALLIKRYPIDLFYWFTQFKSIINSIPDF